MPITFESISHLPACVGNRWTILDENELAKLVAWVAMGKSRHSLKIIHHLQAEEPSVERVAVEAIQNLRYNSDPTRYHRDGWVFQIISWITVHLQGGPTVKGAYPHTIRAHKGLDGLFLDLSENLEAIERVIICEDKATENPANILGSVWSGIQEIESGIKDAQLTDAISAILERYPVANLDAMIEAIHWTNKKAYRVALTTLPEHDDLERRGSLFANYPVVAPGEKHTRRRAETLMLEDVRQWMDSFCGKVIAYIEERQPHV